ncbi:MAG: hypothetical protein ABL925_06195 [Methylococcales bacterium]
MNTANVEMATLAKHLKEWRAQMATLATMQQAAAISTTQLSQELYELSATQLAEAKQKRELELHQSGLYMWENIGCGG